MRINLSLFEETQLSRKALFEKLKLPPDVRLDLAFDVVHGLNELTRSLADLHPHKRSIAVLGPQPPPFSDLAKSFAAQGFTVQTLPASLITRDEKSLSIAFEALKKDTLFVMSHVLEPFTGAFYPYEWLRKEAVRKNIFTIFYQSPDALTQGLIVPENAFESVAADPLWGEGGLTLVLKGERSVGEKLFWGEPRYELSAIKRLEEALLSPLKNLEDKTKVLHFEDQIRMTGHGAHFLGEQVPRLYDRVVVFFDGVGGESLVHLLKKVDIKAFTAAACAWNSPFLNSWLAGLGIPLEWVQSSLILPLSEVSKPQTFKHVTDAVDTLRKISKGS